MSSRDIINLVQMCHLVIKENMRLNHTQYSCFFDSAQKLCLGKDMPNPIANLEIFNDNTLKQSLFLYQP